MRCHTADVTELPVADDDLRVGDDERRAVDERLHRAVGAGQLSLSEYDERARDVWAARTRGQLAAVVRDLPGARPVPAPPDALAPSSGSRRVVAVLGNERLSGAIASGQAVEGYAVLGGARLDLCRDDLPAHVRVRAVAVLGDVEVVVPEGVTVELSGASVVGERSLRLGPAVPGAPVVHLSAVAVMGSVKVRSAGMPTGAARVVAAVRSKLPAQRQAAVAAPRRRRRGRVALAGLGLAGLLATGAVVAVDAGSVPGPPQMAGQAVGDRTVFVQPGQRALDVDGGIGDVTVVVPDGVRAVVRRPGGIGDVDCDEACETTSTDVVTVTITGGVGDVDVETVSEHD